MTREVLLVLLLAGSGALLAARGVDALAAGAARTPVPQLTAFAPWALPGWALALVLAVLGDRRDVVAAAAVALAVQLGWSRRLPRPVAAADGEELTVVTVNAFVGGADRRAVLGLAAGADLLLVQELTPQLAGDLAPLLADAGHRSADLHPGRGGRGTGIWSRHALTPVGLLPSNRNANPAVLLRTPGGLDLAVTGVHTTAPGPGRVWAWRADLAMLAKDVRATSGPRIYAGDFNASADHRLFRDLPAAGLLDAADAAPGRPAFTWPVWRVLPGISLVRLDHVLVTPDIAVLGLRTVRVPGSDHRAVVARLRLPSAGR